MPFFGASHVDVKLFTSPKELEKNEWHHIPNTFQANIKRCLALWLSEAKLPKAAMANNSDHR